MQRIFDEALMAPARARDATEQREILRALDEAALAEHVEWALMHRQRPLEHKQGVRFISGRPLLSEPVS